MVFNMKKNNYYFVTLFLILLFCSCDLSPKYISEAELEEYKNKFIQKGYTSYSFDCSLEYAAPNTYVAHIVIKDGELVTKKFSWIRGGAVDEENCDEKITELKKWKNYENSYDKIFVEEMNTMEDVFELIATIYQREKNEYEQDKTHHHLESEVKYDKKNCVPLYFHCNNSPRPLLPMPVYSGINVQVKNFKVDE